MTDKKRSSKLFYDESAPPTKKVITADLEVNEAITNDV